METKSKKMNYKIYQIRPLSKRKAIFLSIFDALTSFFIKSKKIEIKDPRKILVIRNDHIGDVVLSSGIFREIKKKYPNAKITALVSPQAAPIIEKNKNVDNIIKLGLFWRNLKLKSLINYWKVLRQIRKEKFDVGIDVRASLINIIFLLWLGKIKKRTSYYNLSGGKAFLNEPVLFDKEEHTIKIDINLAKKALNIKTENYWPEIATDEKDEKGLELFVKKNKLKKFICVYPGATNELKRWSVEKFEEVILRFSKHHPDYKILLIGGSDDREIIYKLGKNKNCLPVIDFNLRLLYLLFKKSSLVIANDGGPMHIAWLSGARVIALWGPINLKLMRPLKNSIVLHHQIDCFPCHTEGCKKLKGERCIDLIQVEEVLNAIKKFL